MNSVNYVSSLCIIAELEQRALARYQVPWKVVDVRAAYDQDRMYIQIVWSLEFEVGPKDRKRKIPFKAEGISHTWNNEDPSRLVSIEMKGLNMDKSEILALLYALQQEQQQE